MAISSLAVISILTFSYFVVRLYQQRSKFKNLVSSYSMVKNCIELTDSSQVHHTTHYGVIYQ